MAGYSAMAGLCHGRLPIVFYKLLGAGGEDFHRCSIGMIPYWDNNCALDASLFCLLLGWRCHCHSQCNKVELFSLSQALGIYWPSQAGKARPSHARAQWCNVILAPPTVSVCACTC